MKLSLFKKLIREVIREELDYKFSRLEKKLNEVIVSSDSTDLLSASPNTTQVKETKKLPKVPVPSAGNSVLNEILAETASNDDWKKFMAICEKAREIHGNSFSYTLIESNDIS